MASQKQLFVVLAEDKPGHLQVRLDNRPAHIEFLKSSGSRVKFGGPTLSDDLEGMSGTMMVVEGDSLEEVKAFQANDPYAKAGLFANVIIRPWKLVLNNLTPAV